MQDAFLFGLQLRKGCGWLDAGPNRMRFAIAERPQAIQLDYDRPPPDPVERLHYFIGRTIIDIADKAQGDVVIFRIYPAGAPKTARSMDNMRAVSDGISRPVKSRGMGVPSAKR